MKQTYSAGPIIAAYIVAIGFTAWILGFMGGWPLLVNLFTRIILNYLH